jgi:hypothetical protein
MNDWRERTVSAEHALRCVSSGMRVFVHGAAATLTPVIDALVARRDLDHMTVYDLHTSGPAPHAAVEARDRFPSVSLFAGAPVRDAIARGDVDVVPVLLSDIPSLFRPGRIALDVALLQLSPPDRHGYARSVRRSTPRCAASPSGGDSASTPRCSRMASWTTRSGCCCGYKTDTVATSSITLSRPLSGEQSAVLRNATDAAVCSDDEFLQQT